MLRKSLWSSALMIAGGLLLVGTASWAAGKKVEPPVRLIDSMEVPVAASNATGGMYSFDISYVDQSTQTYYLADRSNKAVDVVDARTGQFKPQIFANPDFRGFTPCPSTVTPTPGSA